MNALTLADKVAAIREAAEGADIEVTNVFVGPDGVTVMYGSWDEAGEAARLASAFFEDDEETCRWGSVGPLGFRGLCAQMSGRERGRYGHVVPFSDVDSLIEGLRSEWRKRYAKEQAVRHPRLVEAGWRCLTLLCLAASVVLAFLCAATASAGDTTPALWLGGGAWVAFWLAPSWDPGPNAAEPPAVAR